MRSESADEDVCTETFGNNLVERQQDLCYVPFKQFIDNAEVVLVVKDIEVLYDFLIGYVSV